MNLMLLFLFQFIKNIKVDKNITYNTHIIPDDRMYFYF
jgi:hypothetical protein